MATEANTRPPEGEYRRWRERLLALEYPSTATFDDPRLAWRRLAGPPKTGMYRIGDDTLLLGVARLRAPCAEPNTKEVAMPLVDKIEKYTVSVFHNDIVDYDRSIRLSLESGGTAQILFPAARPEDWLQFSGPNTTLYLTAADYEDVYHLIQTESPVFFTALNFLGLRVGHVHTELDPAIGEPPGEGDHDANSLEAIIRRARAAGIS